MTTYFDANAQRYFCDEKKIETLSVLENLLDAQRPRRDSLDVRVSGARLEQRCWRRCNIFVGEGAVVIIWRRHVARRALVR